MTWFRFDPDDFWELEEVELLGFDAAGLLWWLISRSWKRGGLKDDPALYREILATRCPNFDELWPKVRAALELGSDGLLRCAWLEEERDASIGRLKNGTQRKRQERLRKRSHAAVTPESRVTAPRQPKDSPKSRAPTYGRTDVEDVRTDKTPARARVPPREAPPTGVAPASPSPAAARPAVNGHAPGVHQEFAAWWCTTFEAVVGRPYGFDGGKDGAHVRAILGFTHGALEPARERALILLHAAPGWIAEGGKDLGTLRSQWNKLASQGTGQATGSKLVAIRDATVPPSSGLLDMPTARRT